MSRIVKNTPFFETLCQLLQGGESVTITVKGWSMGPFLRSERDKVTIAPVESLGRELEVGDIVLFLNRAQDPQHYIMHRIVSIREGLYTLKGDNNPPKMREYCNLEDIKGVLVSCMRDGKVYTPASIKWQLYRRLVSIYRFIL